MTNTITAFATTLYNSKNFWCNLEAGLHDVDLGNNLGLPSDVAVNQWLMIPVQVNSENVVTVGVMESSSSQTYVSWEIRHIQQVVIYSKVQGKSIVAIAITHAIYM